MSSQYSNSFPHPAKYPYDDTLNEFRHRHSGLFGFIVEERNNLLPAQPGIRLAYQTLYDANNAVRRLSNGWRGNLIFQNRYISWEHARCPAGTDRCTIYATGGEWYKFSVRVCSSKECSALGLELRRQGSEILHQQWAE